MNIPVVVVIATSRQRTSLLLSRALPSVFKQHSVNPACIYIVDDNQCDLEHERIVQGAAQLRASFFAEMFPEGVPDDWFPLRVIRNERTKGHSGSGAWNCGALAAWKVRNTGVSQYLAILDDDDEWFPSYLSSCYQLSQQTAAVAVVTSFYRTTTRDASGDRFVAESGSAKDVERVCVTDDALTIDRFYEGNPGWQGSNTFIDIEVFWRAGGFDESMRSTLDRDLAIRVLECTQLSGRPVVANPEPLWAHYIDGSDRVTLCSASKQQGLNQFYHKYAARMTRAQLSASLGRASRLFGYEPDLPCDPSKVNAEDTEWCSFGDEAPVELIIGVASSSARNVREQLLSLHQQIRTQPQFDGYCQYVVLTNGSDEEEIKAVARSFASSALRIRVIGIEEQRRAGSRFPYRAVFAGEALSRKSIAHSRTLLHFFCWEMSQNQDSPVSVLILDDDLLFEAVEIRNGRLATRHLDFLGKIAHLSRHSTADILVSAYTDAPALPFYSSMRTQLLDIYHSLQHLCRSAPDQLPAEGIRFQLDQLSRLSQSDDYYYDLSAVRTDHLECPVVWQKPHSTDKTDEAATLGSFLDDLRHLNEEANITRPLLATPDEWAQSTGQRSFRRGGIALYRSLDLLLDVPNLSPCLEKNGVLTHSRRSDFISSIYMVEALGVAMEKVCLPLRHHRRKQSRPCDLSAAKLADDIIGLCFYRVFSDYCHDTELSEDNLQQRFADLVDDYLDMMSINHFRSEQLAGLITDFLNKAEYAASKSDPQLMLQLEAARADVARFTQEHLRSLVPAQITHVKHIIEAFDVVEQINRIYDTFKQRSIRPLPTFSSGEALSLLGIGALRSQETDFTGTEF